MAFSIAPIAERHAESFQACVDAVARERRFLLQLEGPPVGWVRAFIRENVVQDLPQFVAVEGTRVVGWCDVFRSPAWADAAQHCGTLGMGVHASHRRQGIGRALLRACLAKARGQGITRVVLQVRADNVAAVALAEAEGFVREGIERHAMRFEGAYHDALRLALLQA